MGICPLKFTDIAYPTEGDRKFVNRFGHIIWFKDRLVGEAYEK